MAQVDFTDSQPTDRLRRGSAAPPPSDRGDPPSLADAAHAFRDFLHLHAPQDLDSWCESFRGEQEHARLFREVHRSDPRAAEKLANGLSSFPPVGTSFLGFHLEAELGRGAFGRVYLARQDDLAHRPVALKISAETGDESQTLAQLQHTHIVPIYSCHRAGALQAVCMPYFGATTLADVLRDLNARHRLPDSGKGLVSTLFDRKAKTDRNSGAGSSPSNGSHRSAAAPGVDPLTVTPGPVQRPPQTAESTATLRMLEGMSYVDAILWIGARLADGLAHAHDRGILHRDLKPANVLLTDEGQPMLLDFNLSEDTKHKNGAPAALIGGTLPYMAPEHLAALRGAREPVDARSDLYSLGLILYELLTVRHPFGRYRGPVQQVLPYMITDRLQPPPEMRPWNPHVSPGAEAIIRRCLEPDAADRYQNARDLREDLERQLNDQPLYHVKEPSLRERFAKWRRRHPRLLPIGAALVAVSLLVLTNLALAARDRELSQRTQELAYHEALAERDQFREELRSARLLLNGRPSDRDQLREGAKVGRQALARYQVLDNAAWQTLPAVQRLKPEEQAGLQTEIAELLLLLAGGTAADDQQPARAEALRLNRLAEGCYRADEAPRVLWNQRAQLVASLGQKDEAERLQDRAKKAPAGVGDAHLAARALVLGGRWHEAVTLLQELVRKEPQHFAAWYLLGNCYLDGLARESDAVACYTTCLALWPDFYAAYYNRGLAELRRRHHAEALQDFNRALQLRPEHAESFIHRALVYKNLTKYAEAEADLSAALKLGASPSRLHLLRSEVRGLRGDRPGAAADMQEGLRLEPTDELGWMTRGYVRVAGDPKAALADFVRACELNPRSVAGLQNQAHVLAERLDRNADAVGKLDELLKHYPDYPEALAGRGVLKARLGQRDAALADAKAALLRDTRGQRLYEVACVYALTGKTHPEDRREALRLLHDALHQGFGLDLIANDRDLEPLRGEPQFQDLVKAAQTLKQGEK